MQTNPSRNSSDVRHSTYTFVSSDALRVRAQPNAACAPERTSVEVGATAGIGLDLLNVLEAVSPMAEQIGVEIAAESPLASHVIAADGEIFSILRQVTESAICFGSGTLTISTAIIKRMAIPSNIYAEIQLSRPEMNLPSHARKKISTLLSGLRGETTFRSGLTEDAIAISFPLMHGMA